MSDAFFREVETKVYCKLENGGQLERSGDEIWLTVPDATRGGTALVVFAGPMLEYMLQAIYDIRGISYKTFTITGIREPEPLTGAWDANGSPVS